jgi:hypothetical protein
MTKLLNHCKNLQLDERLAIQGSSKQQKKKQQFVTTKNTNRQSCQ